MSELISLIRLDAFAALDAVIAAAVTVHVLLRKRDVASALGWIGLAWLSPILGGVLYFLLGINRVGRRARRFHRAARPAHGIAPPVPRRTALPRQCRRKPLPIRWPPSTMQPSVSAGGRG